MTSDVQRVQKGLTGLRAARKRAGLTQQELANLVGTHRENLSQWESATKGLSFKMAKRLAGHLEDAHPGEMVTANRLSAYKRAKSEGDAAGALLAVKGLIEAVGDEDLNEAGQRFLNDLADDALAFAEKSSGGHEDTEVYGVIPDEGRDPAGYNVGVTKAAASRSGAASIYPDLPRSRGSAGLPDPEEYDEPGHDGRNLHGHRVAPLPGRDEEEEW